MHDIILNPNPRKLAQYFELTEELITKVETEGVVVELDFQTEETYDKLKVGFSKVCMDHSLSEHFEELFYLLLRKNEQIMVRYEAYCQNYDDDLTTKEVAQFLLAYKEAGDKTYLTLALKPSIGSTATLKDTRVVKWICKVVVEQIEQGLYPISVLGEKISYDLFGSDFQIDTPLDLERLKAAANLKPKKPSTRLKRLYVELCLHLSNYLIEHTTLTMSEGKLLTDAQANFFFDTLVALGYLKEDAIDSDKKDYMWTMFKNYLRYYKTGQ